ncbi:MAG TPA: hypothetical protein VFO09_06035, partial [Methyloceanibacter sp.]|nr:hypothetical protein [Methyloceanibacter sp.]
MLPNSSNRLTRPLFAATGAKGKVKPEPVALADPPKTKLGGLPEWNLADLYPAPDSPKLKTDL